MEDWQSSSGQKVYSESSLVASEKNKGKGSSSPENSLLKPLCRIISKDGVGGGVSGDVAFFVLKLVALETMRRVSESKCPFAWRSLQACQMLCYPPFKWVQRWAPFKGLVQGMRILSRPLMIISIATAFSDISDKMSAANDHTASVDNVDNDSSSLQPCVDGDTRNENEPSTCLPLENWMLKLYKELKQQGFSLPERLDESELQRFYTAANGDFSSLLSSVKKTIRWRETFNILSQEELKMWSSVVFWHGHDVRQRPCLIVRLGVACTSLQNHDRPRFAQAIVSQLEHGIMHLADHGSPQVMVLVDCESLSPFRLPFQMIRSCSMLFQDHYPNCLGGLFVIRLPPVLRMMVQTFMKVLKPLTRQKLEFLGERYREVLSEYFQELPACLGGTCICATCSSGTSNTTRTFPFIEVLTDAHLSANGYSCEGLRSEYLRSEADVNQNFDHLLRTAMIGILMLCVFGAILAGIYESEIWTNSIP
ncbi:uncharacterized protein LOC141616023 [Silene latifolia]|uniref:uncharacterized protein LOC141616023 n=1 Tax=Silene latifolia TaxID=37657 RepID=UPI003D76FC2A